MTDSEREMSLYHGGLVDQTKPHVEVTKIRDAFSFQVHFSQLTCSYELPDLPVLERNLLVRQLKEVVALHGMKDEAKMMDKIRDTIERFKSPQETTLMDSVRAALARIFL